MLETTRPNRPESYDVGPGGPDELFNGCGAGGGMVTVNSGLHTERLPVGNMTIAEIHSRYSDRFDIDPLSQAHVDGNPVADDVTVQPGQILMFVRQAGEKGAPR